MISATPSVKHETDPVASGQGLARVGFPMATNAQADAQSVLRQLRMRTERTWPQCRSSAPAVVNLFSMVVSALFIGRNFLARALITVDNNSYRSFPCSNLA